MGPCDLTQQQAPLTSKPSLLPVHKLLFMEDITGCIIHVNHVFENTLEFWGKMYSRSLSHCDYLLLSWPGPSENYPAVPYQHLLVPYKNTLQQSDYNAIVSQIKNIIETFCGQQLCFFSLYDNIVITWKPNTQNHYNQV